MHSCFDRHDQPASNALHACSWPAPISVSAHTHQRLHVLPQVLQKHRSVLCAWLPASPRVMNHGRARAPCFLQRRRHAPFFGATRLFWRAFSGPESPRRHRNPTPACRDWAQRLSARPPDFVSTRQFTRSKRRREPLLMLRGVKRARTGARALAAPSGCCARGAGKQSKGGWCVHACMRICTCGGGGWGVAEKRGGLAGIQATVPGTIRD